MKIGIDISQLAYENTGVAGYLSELVKSLIIQDSKNEYILFCSSLRKNFKFQISNFKLNSNVKIKQFRLPPIVLDLLWNKLHIVPIESLIGDIDVFITSDWTEPPTRKAKKATILYDLIVYKYPEETHNKTRFNLTRLNILPNIVKVQRRKLHWVKKESDIVLCISEATKQDANDILGINKEKLKVIYPGLN
jgi:hypothetical protein